MSKGQRHTQEYFYRGGKRYEVGEEYTGSAPDREFQHVKQDGTHELFVLVDVTHKSKVLARVGVRYISYNGGMVLESVGLLRRRHGVAPHIYDAREVPTVVRTSPYWKANTALLYEGEPVTSMGSDPYGSYRIHGLVIDSGVRVERDSNTGNGMWFFLRPDDSSVILKIPSDLLGIALGKIRALGEHNVEVELLKRVVKRLRASGNYDFAMPDVLGELI